MCPRTTSLELFTEGYYLRNALFYSIFMLIGSCCIVQPWEGLLTQFKLHLKHKELIQAPFPPSHELESLSWIIALVKLLETFDMIAFLSPTIPLYTQLIIID